MKCANCTNYAEYTDCTLGVNPVNYCLTCLPESLRLEAAQGRMPLVAEKKEEESDAARGLASQGNTKSKD